MEMVDKRRLELRRSWSHVAIDAALRMRRSEHKARDAEERRIGLGYWTLRIPLNQ